jgi:hypothetical protein
MADHRAMEEQQERENPINEKTLLEHRSEAEQHNRLSGQGVCGGSATPSMGLSMYRGGAKHTLQDHLKHPNKGFGKQKKPSEAHEMGRHLGLHLHQLHGGAFHKDFMAGMGMCGGRRNFGGDEDEGPEGYVRPVDTFDAQGFRIPKTDVNAVMAQQAKDNYIKKASPSEKAFMGITSGLLDIGHSGLDKAGSVIPGSQGVAETIRGFLPKRGSGKESQRAKVMLGEKKMGRSRNNGPPLLSGNVNGNVSGGTYGRSRKVGAGTGAGMLEEPMPMPGTNLNLSGGADTGAYEGQGKGRSARAALVKKIMAEKGLKMIEASKYVKQHNLY